MVAYAFEKLYADLVTSDGTACIVYVAWTELFGARHCTAGLELYAADGRRTVIHARGTPKLPDLDADAWRVRLDTPSGPIELRHEALAGGWAPEPGRADLSWCVKSARGRSELRFLGDSQRSVLSGYGYADWVVLRRPTRQLDLEQVDWGRAHVGGETLVWNRIRAGRGRSFTRVLSLGAGREETNELAIDEHDGGVTVSTGAKAALELDRGRVLHDGPALDDERFPSPLTRGLVALVSPKMTETRWVRRARRGEERGWALHERVRFGSSA
ncbi:MAG TPA: hypothetical protein VGK73_37555 [Polyangiaceae bacterium]